MSPKALRNWGLGTGVAALAAAIAIATFTRNPADAPEPEAPPTMASALPKITLPHLPRRETEPAASAQPAAPPRLSFAAGADETAASADNPPATFLVRFEEGHPLARAQALAAAGREEAARTAAERVLSHSRALRGLCFDHFTVGGAEIVLKPCEPVPADERDAFRRAWAERLSAMPGVAYAEANVIVRPETAPPQ